MGVSDIRVKIHTDNILKKYLQNGTIPDEFVVQQQLEQDLAAYFDPSTNTFNANQPLWLPTNLTYRQASNAAQWNATQNSASEDMRVLYEDFIEQVQTLTNKLYDYVTSTVRLKTKLQKLRSRIENLLLVSTSTDGFTFSFFDTFVDTSKTSFSKPFFTTAVINPETQSVQIGNKTQPSLDGNLETTTNTLNLLFLQPSDVNFFVLNPVPPGGIISLSTASLTDIFNNQANAWQQQITITGTGPLVAQLTVQVSPLDSITINKVALQTKMTDAANQIIIQLQYSSDGISYFDVPSANGSQVVAGATEFNFSPIQAKFFRFIITKNQADSGLTYNIGFQYISFQQVSYLDGGDFYSIPISFPDGHPISKLALDTCSIVPPGTDIKYGIIRAQGNTNVEIPISSIEDTSPQFAQVLDISSFTPVDSFINTSAPSGFLWTPDSSGYLHANVRSILPSGVNASGLNFADSNIPQTMEIFRNIGPIISGQPYDSVGWVVNPSGLPGYFQTIVEINNAQGINIAIGNNQVILDNQLVTGTMSLTEGLHKVATVSFDQLQIPVADNSDQYFAWNMKYASLFDFYNNVAPLDQSFFTYDPSIGDIIINPVVTTIQKPAVDNDTSFFPSPINDGTFMSSSQALPNSSIAGTPTLINAGQAILIEADATNHKGKWVNEIDITSILSYIPSIVSVQYSMDQVSWSDILTNVPGPLTNVLSVGAFKFPAPVYAKFFRVLWVEGSQINTSTSQVLVYPPVFRIPNTIQSTILYQPTGTVWDHVFDTQMFATNQTLSLIDGFNNASLGTFVENSSWITNISSIHIPKIVIIANSNSGTIDPFLSQLQVISNPISNELSEIRFNFLNANASESVTQVTLHATLSSNFEGVTPELKNYRVKLL